MNSFGRIFRLSIFGESHGSSVGVLIDGIPPGIAISDNDFFEDLLRRQKKGIGSTTRNEKDIPNIKSGIFNCFTSGSPMLIEFENEEYLSNDYLNFQNIPRPGHADFVSKIKFNKFNDINGGGHFSGRLTLGLVAAGVVAKKILGDISIKSEILEIGGKKDYHDILKHTLEEGDSLGGLIECKISGIPIGFGEPFFDSIESLISHLVFSIPGIKGIEFGKGFDSAKILGSQMNDLIIDSTGKTSSNNSGGINGGISNGNEIVFRVVVKPTSSIIKIQKTLNIETNTIEELLIKGRHDTCFALRVPVILESVAAIVLTDLLLINKAFN